MFKATIEIDNVEDYQRINGNAKPNKPKNVCPFCGSDQLVFQNKNDYEITKIDGTSIKSQAVDLRCLECGMMHPKNESNLVKINE